MPKLAFEFSSLNELHGFCTEFVLNWAKAAEVAKSSKQKSEPAVEETEEKPAKKVKVAVEETEEKPSKKAKAAEDAEEKISYDQVRAAMMRLEDTDEEETITAIITKLGVEKLSQLKESQFAKAIELFDKAYKRSSPVTK